MSGWAALEKVGNAARKAREAISPWKLLSPTDVAGFAPGGGLVQAWQDSGKGWQSLKRGDYGQAAVDYGSMALNTIGELAPLSKLGMAALIPALRNVPDALPLQGGGRTVYHGTGRAYDEPRLGAPETTLGRNNLEAHYVTARPETANAYSTDTSQWRINQEGWAPQTRIYSMGDADTLALTPDEFWIAKRVGTGQDPATFGKHAKGEYERYTQFMQDAFGEAPRAGESFTEFLQRKRVQSVTSGGSKPEEIMVTDPSVLRPKFEQPQGMAALPEPQGITAYHGSPHDFDRFDMSKIGTGEGAQAYGHGLYFAENEGVARGYRDALTPPTKQGMVGPQGLTQFHRDLEKRAMKMPAGEARSIYNRMDLIEQLDSLGDVDAVRKLGKDGTFDADTMAWFEREIVPKFKPAGRMYQVRINANPDDFLDWDKPLSDRARKLLRASPANEALEKRGYAGGIDGFGDRPGSALHDQLALAFRQPSEAANRNRAAEVLKEAGIPGIKYLDAGSRGAGDGTRNYVVFDDKLVSILKKYGWVPGMAIPAAAMMEYQQQGGQAPQM